MMTPKEYAQAALLRHFGFQATEADWQAIDCDIGLGQAIEDAVRQAVGDAVSECVKIADDLLSDCPVCSCSAEAQRLGADMRRQCRLDSTSTIGDGKEAEGEAS